MIARRLRFLVSGRHPWKYASSQTLPEADGERSGADEQGDDGHDGLEVAGAGEGEGEDDQRNCHARGARQQQQRRPARPVSRTATMVILTLTIPLATLARRQCRVAQPGAVQQGGRVAEDRVDAGDPREHREENPGASSRRRARPTRPGTAPLPPLSSRWVTARGRAARRPGGRRERGGSRVATGGEGVADERGGAG